MKKIFFTFLLFFLFYPLTFSNTCKYQEKFDKCTKAIEDFTWKKDFKKIVVWWSLKDFHDFPCIQDWVEERFFQIAMDENFKEIDDEMDNYLKDLYNNKDFYFSDSSEYDYFDALEHIFLKKYEFKKRYDSACIKSLEEVSTCLWKKTKDSSYKWTVSVLWVLDFISWSWWAWKCFLLADLKTNIFLDISYNGLLLNRQQNFKDKLKLETQVQRENYWRLLESMRVNQSYIERLNSKWTSKTKHTLNSR